MKITLVKPGAQELRSPAADLPEKPSFPQKPPRRKIRSSGAGMRVKGSSGSPASKRGSRPGTPLVRWKFDEGNGKNGSVEDEKSSGEVGRRARRKMRPALSARKLGAGLWRLHSPEEKNSGGGRKSVGVLYNGGRFGNYPVNGHQLDRLHSTSAKDSIHSPRSFSNSKHGLLYKLSNSEMEGATKWAPFAPRESDEIHQIFNTSKPHKTRGIKSSQIASLERELELANSRIHELETERRSSRKKLEHFLHKLGEERAAWRSREHEKIRAFIDDAKSDLKREKKARQRLEAVNSKLVNQLTEAKSTAKRCVQEYDKERKSREMLEEVCDELAKELGEDKAELEALRTESIRFREDVEEERKMLQMAEVWREERVQMKIVDAKIMLEEKYSYMKEIASKIESFLTSRGSKPEGTGEIERAEFLRRAASSVEMRDIREIKYEPANAEDIFSVFEDVNFADKEIQPCNDEDEQQQSNNNSSNSNSSMSPVSRGSRVLHKVSPNMHYKDRNGGPEGEEEDGEASEWETVSHNEGRGSSYSPEGSDPSVNDGYYRASDASRTEWEKKGYSISKLWRSGGVSNGGAVVVITGSPDAASTRGDGISGNWGSPDAGNKGMKGCMEWPRSSSSATQKSSLKSRLLEARLESQKVQLRQVLKQKI